MIINLEGQFFPLIFFFIFQTVKHVRDTWGTVAKDNKERWLTDVNNTQHAIIRVHVQPEVHVA